MMRGLGLGLAMILSAGTAAAQNSQNWEWSGGYVGLTFGMVNGKVKDFATGAGTANAQPEITGTGPSLGVAVGFSSPFPRRPDLVYGGDFEYNVSSAGDTRPCPDAAFRCEATIERFGSVRGHIGKVQGNTMMFANAGVAFGSVDGQIDFIGTGQGTSGGGSTSLQGFVVGVGFETRLNQRLNIRFDASQYLFDSKNVNLAGTTQDKVGLNATHLRLGIVSRF